MGILKNGGESGSFAHVANGWVIRPPSRQILQNTFPSPPSDGANVVGSGVGAGVGSKVGTGVGAGVGTGVGRSVGRGVGTAVGAV